MQMNKTLHLKHPIHKIDQVKKDIECYCLTTKGCVKQADVYVTSTSLNFM